MKAIVMGATSGIGMEVARQLAAKGWKVGIAGRRTERLAALAESVEGIVAYKSIDIMSDDAPALLTELIEEMGGVDLYFHSSGIGWQNEMLDMGKELSTVATNCAGLVRMTDTLLGWFAAKCGAETRDHAQHDKPHLHIACITSIAGTKGLGAAPAYSASKRFQSHYLESLQQLATIRHLNVSITDIRPGFVATPLIEGSRYPLQLKADDVAAKAIKAIERGKKVSVIDWRYAILVRLWRLIPRSLWVKLPINAK